MLVLHESLKLSRCTGAQVVEVSKSGGVAVWQQSSFAVSNCKTPHRLSQEARQTSWSVLTSLVQCCAGLQPSAVRTAYYLLVINQTPAQLQSRTDMCRSDALREYRHDTAFESRAEVRSRNDW